MEGIIHLIYHLTFLVYCRYNLTWFFTRYLVHCIIVLSIVANIKFNEKHLAINDDSIKNTIHQINYIIKNNIYEFDLNINSLKKKNQKLFNQIILSIQNENDQKSSLPTAKIVKITKNIKLIIQIKLILEQLELKFSTVKKLMMLFK